MSASRDWTYCENRATRVMYPHNAAEEHMTINDVGDQATSSSQSHEPRDEHEAPGAIEAAERPGGDGLTVIVVAATKGGVGKTTLTLNLAAAAEAAGDGPSAMVDMDPQGSLTHLYNRRKREGGPVMLASGEGTLADTLAFARRSGIRMVVIDTPPA